MVPVAAATAADLDAGRIPQLPADRLDGLRRYQLLVPANEDELAAVTDRFTTAAADLSRRHIVLFPTAYCNMGCTYCGQTHRKQSLRGNHRDAVRQRTLAVLEHPQTRAVRLDWFGGEPLMGYATLRELARAFLPVVDRRGLEWSSTIVTNGALLDYRKIKTLAIESRVTHAEITVDGPPEIHDQHRPLKAGGGSFWKIVRAIGQALEDDSTAGMTFGIRTNVDVHNEDAVERLLRLLAEHGFAHSRVRFGIKPVHSWGNDISAMELGKQHFADRETHWLALMSDLGLNFEVLPPEPAPVVCPAVTRSDEFIVPDGKVFSCSEQPLVDHLAHTAVGAVTDEWAATAQPRPEGAFDDWHADVAAGGRGCSTCPLYPTCGGACPKLWREGHWPCPSFKFNIQARLDLIATMNGFTLQTPTLAGAGA
ncbi:radical SAM/SPASM domain-containing protein [Salinispora cortesiana]|uniref:radical SAM/SPASM domain-containing protein n=1 Tax=Salinispora cortesiana TaxID=1305843 RepID=UPI001CB755A6|nr:radical SAM protein [Salinispora cortesiana]